MARIRSIHPSLWTDEAFVSLSMCARLFAIGLWSECDDEGVFEWKPLTLKMKIMPADNVDIGAMLDELLNQRLIVRYEMDGRPLGAVRNFCKFQRPQKPKVVHPKTEEIREFVGLKPSQSETDIGPVQDDYDTGTVKPIQMKDEGGKREEEKTNPSDYQKKSVRKNKTKLPDDCPTAGDKQRAVEYWQSKGRNDLDLDEQAEKFRAHHAAHGSSMASWPYAWKTWYVNAVSFNRPTSREGPGKVLPGFR